MSELEPQTFCLYCQRNFSTPGRLQVHLRAKHPGTHAQVNLAPPCVDRNETDPAEAGSATSRSTDKPIG